MISSAAASDRTPETSFGFLLRRWRAVRHLTQLDLALEADISTRHLSWIETGRAQPSREMVLRLSDALQVPLRERNTLLVAAGYAQLYPNSGLDREGANAARHAVELFMAQFEPYPVLIVDRYWNILRMNSGAALFFSLFPGLASVTPANGVRFVFHPNGLRPFIENWQSVAARIIQRVHREVLANPWDDGMKSFVEELLSYPNVPSRWGVLNVEDSPPPFLTINYNWNNSTLRLFSTVTTFGTAQDVSLQELRIECFFPADETTRTALRATPIARR